MIVGLSGGSNLDLAKIAAVVFTRMGAMEREYVSGDKVPGPLLPIVYAAFQRLLELEAIVSCSCVLTDEEQKSR